ncbi:MAG: HlyD family efflux transporter periplasmic adaptor subunit [Candidatus Wallbacteria bacterium]|nr:HlyD family efflux transporter periplasmic adaptor subunit [Candidatus Wallbacteria bacterium]
MRAFILLFGVCGLIGFLAVGEFPRQSERPGLFSGRIEADALLLAPEMGGTVATLQVAEGQWVKQGEPIASLDPRELAAVRDKAAALVERARARAASTSEAIELTADTARLELAQSRAAWARATETARLVELGPRAEAIARSRSALAQAQALASEATREAERLGKLSRGGSLPEQQLDRARTELAVRQLGADVARSTLQEALSGSRPQEIAAAKAEAERLDAARRLAVAGERRVALARRDREAALRELAAAEADLALAAEQLRKTRLVAPRDGLIDEVLRRPGEVARPGDAIVRLLDLDHPYVRVFLTSEVLSRIALGAPAKVLIDASEHSGRIARVARRAEFTPKDVQTRERRVSLVYEVKVAVDDPKRELKAGQPADVTL